MTRKMQDDVINPLNKLKRMEKYMGSQGTSEDSSDMTSLMRTPLTNNQSTPGPDI